MHATKSSCSTSCTRTAYLNWIGVHLGVLLWVLFSATPVRAGDLSDWFGKVFGKPSTDGASATQPVPQPGSGSQATSQWGTGPATSPYGSIEPSTTPSAGPGNTGGP